LEAAIIIALSALCIWYSWRLYSLRKGIEALGEALRKDPVPALRDLSPHASQPRLHKLSTAALDTVAESTLLRDSEQTKRQFLEALLNEIKDAIFILDGAREIRFVNEAARQLFPSDQPYIAKSFFDICRDHRIQDTVELAEEVGSKVSDRIVMRMWKEGDERMREVNLLVEAEPLVFSPDEQSGSWVLLRDITNELETEQIRRDFVANASHELRTPLSIINGYLETMEEETDLNNAIYRRAVTTMRKHGDRIARIVDDMLTISKLEDNSDLLNREPFDLRDSVNDMIDQLMPLIEEQHARVKVIADESQSWVLLGDRFYWDQVFFNLIENALKQNREPGLKIKIRFQADKGRYVISVADDGIGIPASDLPLIFKRFYRVQKHHAQTVQGTGLGLSIVKRAVEAHHGTISVNSHPGQETEFTINVPQTGISVPKHSDSTAANGE